jgi:hypothetical protein
MYNHHLVSLTTRLSLLGGVTVNTAFSETSNTVSKKFVQIHMYISNIKKAGLYSRDIKKKTQEVTG